jgi:hypothetical protein
VLFAPATHRQRQRDGTRLSALVDVPEGFFACTFLTLGLLLSASRNFARVRLEERAWERRLEEGRAALLRRNPALTELELRRREAASEWSAYGQPRLLERYAAARQRRVSVLDRDDDGTGGSGAQQDEYRMTEEEIEAFESEYGVTYDPYYDDPYTEDELPEGKFEVDKLYGDRFYENGEIFYKDAASGLFYRQGSKPRNLTFFG